MPSRHLGIGGANLEADCTVARLFIIALPNNLFEEFLATLTVTANTVPVQRMSDHQRRLQAPPVAARDSLHAILVAQSNRPLHEGAPRQTRRRSSFASPLQIKAERARARCERPRRE